MYQPGSNIDPATTTGPELADKVEDIGFVARGTVKSRTSAQPGSPSEGDAYLVNADASWGGSQHDLALYTDAWRYVTPEDGWSVWVEDEDLWVRYSSALGKWVRASGKTVQVIEASGTWNRPEGCTHVEVEVQGEGAPGNDASSAATHGAFAGQGGASGAYARKHIDVRDIASATITIGTYNPNVATRWADGVNTDVVANSAGVAVISESGSAVEIAQSSSFPQASGGDINVDGVPGEPGFAFRGTAFDQAGNDTKFAKGGVGGSSTLGRGGAAFATGSDGGLVVQQGEHGNNAAGYGAGGGGACVIGTGATFNGGDPAPGVVIVHEYYD